MRLLSVLLLCILVGPAAADDEAPYVGKGEVIEIHDPPVKPKALNFNPRKTPPYSDAAVLSDAWTKAWMLLDVSERGDVTRVKFLKRPGFDLEKIAIKEAFKLKFSPARDGRGNPLRVYVVWPIEWPSAGGCRRSPARAARCRRSSAFRRARSPTACRAPARAHSTWTRCIPRIAIARGRICRARPSRSGSRRRRNNSAAPRV